MGNSLRLILAIVMADALLAIPALAQADDPARAVFMLQTVRLDGNGYKGMEYGTAFFISSDGSALTNSHLVYRVQHDPDHYHLIAIVDKEFYSAEIVCASNLQDDPTREGLRGVHLSRDVAEIRLMPSAFPFDTFALTFKTGERLTFATAHRDALRPFPFLTIAGRPALGTRIHIIGFGHISPIPRKWTSRGQISRTGQTPDGTEIFDIEFTHPAQPGNSGSPVFNDQNQVIGLWTWYASSRSDLGTAISSSALKNPCPNASQHTARYTARFPVLAYTMGKQGPGRTC